MDTNRVSGTYKYQFSIAILLAGLMFFGTSCIKEIPDSFPSAYIWHPEFAIPIGDVNFNLAKAIGFDPALLELDSLGMEYWTYLDTIPMNGELNFEFDNVLGDIEQIKSLSFRMNFYNGFPVKIDVQVYLINQMGSIVDSMFESFLPLERGETKAGGLSGTPSLTQADVAFPEERLDVLNTVSSINIVGELESDRLVDQYSLNIQIGAIVGLETELKF